MSLTIERDVLCDDLPGYSCKYKPPKSTRAQPQRSSGRALIWDQAYWELERFAAQVCQSRGAEWIRLQYVTYQGESGWDLSGTVFDCATDGAAALAAPKPTRPEADEDHDYWVLRVPNGVTKVPVQYSGSGSPSTYECRLTGYATLTWQCGSVSAKAAVRGAGSFVFEARGGRLTRVQVLR